MSFYSVDVYPDPANTFDELEKKVAEEGIEIRVCCSHIRLASDFFYGKKTFKIIFLQNPRPCARAPTRSSTTWATCRTTE